MTLALYIITGATDNGYATAEEMNTGGLIGCGGVLWRFVAAMAGEPQLLGRQQQRRGASATSGREATAGGGREAAEAKAHLSKGRRLMVPAEENIGGNGGGYSQRRERSGSNGSSGNVNPKNGVGQATVSFHLGAPKQWQRRGSLVVQRGNNGGNGALMEEITEAIGGGFGGSQRGKIRMQSEAVMGGSKGWSPTGEITEATAVVMAGSNGGFTGKYNGANGGGYGGSNGGPTGEITEVNSVVMAAQTEASAGELRRQRAVVWRLNELQRGKYGRNGGVNGTADSSRGRKDHESISFIRLYRKQLNHIAHKKAMQPQRKTGSI
ncbi:uncharacterized transmembrane protein DDB_G0289901-like [Penaeus indicus]|uniref:uncharacterized transmembrane protein DDB_G0289901-like n=1 Tax=Penaeus indicus TaxID=29960 RepID=UPI00300D4FCE